MTFWMHFMWITNDFHEWVMCELFHIWQKIIVHVKPYMMLFLITYFMLCTHKPHPKKHWLLISSLPSRLAFFNPARHWYYDIIFANCPCMWKLVQSWYALVNIIHECWSPTTCHSLCNLLETRQLTICNNCNTHLLLTHRSWILYIPNWQSCHNPCN